MSSFRNLSFGGGLAYSGRALVLINVVALRRAKLVPGWVIVRI